MILVLEAENGDVRELHLNTELGKNTWPGEKETVGRFVGDVQCSLNRNPRNEWMAIPKLSVPNPSFLNGQLMVGKEMLKDGDVLAVGNPDTGVAKVPVTVRLVTAADLAAAEVPAEAPPESEADSPEFLNGGERTRVRDFVHDILQPVFRDGLIDFPEETPLAFALVAYGIKPLIDRKKEAVVHQIVETLGEVDPTEATPMRDVWETRLFPLVMAFTQAELRETHSWLVGEARERGQDATFPLVPDGMHGDLLRTQNTGTIYEDSKQSLLDFCREVLEHVQAELDAGTEKPAPAEEERLVVASAVEEEPPEPEPLEELRVVEVECAALSVERLKELKGKVEAGAGVIISNIEHALSEGNRPQLAFEQFREGAETKAVFVEEFDADNHNLWFVGDVHGDFVALQHAMTYIREFEPDKEPYVVFLGDLVDRGHDSFAAVLYVFVQLLGWPGRIALLVGNHDEGLMWKEDASEFGSTVMPSEFVDWLNNPPEEHGELAKRLGQTLIKLYAYAPAALFLPGGTFAAHGGMPHCDLLDNIKDRASLNDIDCVTDFIWTRVSRNSRHKEPNRLTRGCEFGYEDFYAFCKLVTERLNFPVKRMVRGHDHIEDRYQLHKRCKDYRMLTVNNMSHRLEGEYFWNGGYVRPPCLARYMPNGLPEVHVLKIPEGDVAQFYPLPEPGGAG